MTEMTVLNGAAIEELLTIPMAVEALGTRDCIQCMCCSYICPSRQSVAGEILLYRRKRKGGETE